MLQISNTVSIPEYEIEMSAVRSQGVGGKTSTTDIFHQPPTPILAAATQTFVRMVRGLKIKAFKA